MYGAPAASAVVAARLATKSRRFIIGLSPCRLRLWRCRPSTQSILAHDLILGQPTDTRQRPAAVGDDDRDDDLVGARRIGDAHLEGVEVAADIGGVLMA